MPATIAGVTDVARMATLLQSASAFVRSCNNHPALLPGQSFKAP